MKGPGWQQLAPFAELSPGDLARLTERLEERSLAAGEALCVEGADAEGAFLLAAGALDCAREGLDPLGRIEAPAVLGLAALAAHGRREASLTAAEPSRVLVLTRDGFRRFADDAPQGALHVLEGIARELGGLLRGGIGALAAKRG